MKTIALILSWIIINFCFYGQLVIEALHLEGGNSSSINLQSYFITVFGEIPSLAISLYLIDHPSFGRKYSLVCFFLGACISHLLFAGTEIAIIGSLARFFMKDVFQILYPLTTESFDTRIRTKGFGLCSGSGRIGSIIMPFILIPLDSYSRASVYILFSILSIIACFISLFMIE